MSKGEMVCPRCEKTMALVAAGWYCMRDGVLIDPVTGKPVEAVKPKPVEGRPPEILDRLFERLAELYRRMPIIRIEPSGLRLALVVSYGLAAGAALEDLILTQPPVIVKDPWPTVLMGFASALVFLAPILFVAQGGFERGLGFTCFYVGYAIVQTVYASVTGGPPWLRALPWTVLIAVLAVLGTFQTWRKRLKHESRSENTQPAQGGESQELT